MDANDTLQEIHEALFPEIHVVASMNHRHMTELMKMVDSFDIKTRGMTDFRHHSKWLLLRQEENTVDLQVFRYLENVIVVPHHYKCWLQSVFTLKRHLTRNEWVPVAACNQRNINLCYFPNTAYGYNNRRLVVTTLESSVFIVKSTNNGTTQYKGYAIDVLDTLAAALNFSYSITEPQDKSWGLPVNETYDGIVGQLNRTEVDLAASDLTIHDGRSQFMEYIYPPIRTEYIDVVYKRHDKQRTTSLFLLALPFRPLVYLILLLMAGLCALLLAVLESVDFGGNETASDSGDVGFTSVKKVKQNLFSACWEVTGSLFKQGFSKYPRTLSGKVFVMSWWMLLMVMTTVYCANLVAALSAETDVKTFSDLEGLLDSDYSVGIERRGIAAQILESSLPSSVNGRIWAKISTNDPVFLESNAEVHFKRVRSEKYAFLEYRSTINHLMTEFEDFQLEVLGEHVLWFQLAFGLPQRSPLKADFEKVMSQLSASGILNVLWRKWSVNRNLTHCPRERVLKSIGVTQIGGGFIIVCAGTALSIIVLILENRIHLMQK
ncbi:glutamate receptor ionotropic, kainate 4-like [Haliotis cracherodii]|uniref:glutamate receptor ionotropic, kainate 4-like n=1 Tax=Haliotis cracherodii TaxID=6455 RepID=UPI0039EB5E4C